MSMLGFLPFSGNDIIWPALDEVDGGVKFGPFTGLEYEGTGVNATTLGTILDARGITSANKAQTGDSYAIVNGDHGLVSIQDDIDEILTDTGTTLDALLDRIAVTCIGNVTQAGTASEIFTYGGVTATIAVDSAGNRTLVFS